MGNYIVSARKYRPSTFKTVVGQQALTHTLKTAIGSDRLAHAYLFCGPRGVGKTSCARIFAKTINCEHLTADGDACNECESCKAFNEQRSYNIVELDAASNNSVDDIRNLCDQVRIPPQIGKYKVFIIDEVHMLSNQAFNAFLKTLEEPPAHAIFILATTEKHKIIPTILSRCQIYDFHRIRVQDIVEQLSYIAQNEGINAEPMALNVIAQKADGAMRDALSIFDQVAASSEGNITYKSTIDNLNVLDHDYYFRLIDTFIECNVPQALLIYEDIRNHGFDSQFFINGLAEHIRSLMVASTPATKVLLETSDDVANQFVAQAGKLSPMFFYKALDLCSTCDLNYRTATNKRLLVELTLIKICQLFDTTTPPTGGGNDPGIKKINPSATPQATTQQPQRPAVQQAPQARPTATPSQMPKPIIPRQEATQTVQPTAPATVPAAPHPATAQQPQRPISASAILQNNTNIKLPKVEAPRISITNNSNGNNAQQGGSQSYHSTTSRNNSYTDDQLLTAWMEFIRDNPSEKIIVNTMRVAQPKKVEENLYEIQVENQIQVDSIHSHLNKILGYLRDRVQNDMLALNVKIRQGGPAPRFWSPQEIIAETKKHNPNIERLIKTFECGLA